MSPRANGQNTAPAQPQRQLLQLKLWRAQPVVPELVVVPVPVVHGMAQVASRLARSRCSSPWSLGRRPRDGRRLVAGRDARPRHGAPRRPDAPRALRDPPRAGTLPPVCGSRARGTRGRAEAAAAKMTTAEVAAAAEMTAAAREAIGRPAQGGERNASEERNRELRSMSSLFECRARSRPSARGALGRPNGLGWQPR